MTLHEIQYVAPCSTIFFDNFFSVWKGVWLPFPLPFQRAQICRNRTIFTGTAAVSANHWNWNLLVKWIYRADAEILCEHFFIAFSMANSFSSPKITWEMTYRRLNFQNLKKIWTCKMCMGAKQLKNRYFFNSMAQKYFLSPNILCKRELPQKQYEIRAFFKKPNFVAPLLQKSMYISALTEIAITSVSIECPSQIWYF